MIDRPPKWRAVQLVKRANGFFDKLGRTVFARFISNLEMYEFFWRTQQTAAHRSNQLFFSGSSLTTAAPRMSSAPTALRMVRASRKKNTDTSMASTGSA